VGERYILGGEILSLKQILDILAEVSGCPQVRVRIPSTIAFVWAYVDVALARIIPGYTPMATPEKVRISMRGEPFDSAKAVKELGFPQTPAREALRKAVEWYLANGYTAS
jgi:dihydroflavonol-4-reductase